MKKKFLSLALCATLTLSVFGASVPVAQAANASATVYTFADPNGPWPDLYKEAQRREKNKKKAALTREQEQREKFARMKAQSRK